MASTNPAAASLRKFAKNRGLRTQLKDDLFSFFDADDCVFEPAGAEDARLFLRKVDPLRRRGRQ